MGFTVIYDACVLFPAPLRDLLIRLAQTDVVHARWTDEILDECFRNIAARRPELGVAALSRTRTLMNDAVRDCLVTSYTGLADGLHLPDPDDRHVIAAAIRSGSQAIITFNLKDFPSTTLAPLGIEAMHPDDFVADLLDLAPAVVIQVLDAQAAALRNPPRRLDDLLVTLENNGLAKSVAEVQRLRGQSG
jgi:predicted nucleic acid-binding protein